MLGAMMLLDVLNLENAASELGPIEELAVRKLGLRDETLLEMFGRYGHAVRHEDQGLERRAWLEDDLCARRGRNRFRERVGLAHDQLVLRQAGLEVQ
jgi:hypothetical protein